MVLRYFYGINKIPIFIKKYNLNRYKIPFYTSEGISENSTFLHKPPEYLQPGHNAFFTWSHSDSILKNIELLPPWRQLAEHCPNGQLPWLMTLMP